MAASNKPSAEATHPNFVGKDDRQFGAWSITTDVWTSQGATIVLPINPESLEIGQRIRSSEVAMMGGKYFSVGRNPRTKSVYEFPSIAFKFNSGNIQPVFSTDYIAGVEARDKIVVKTGQVVAESVKPSSGNVGNHVYGRYKGINAAKGSGVPGLYNEHKEIPIGVQNLYAMLSMIQHSWMFEKTEHGFDGSPVGYSVLNRVIIHTTSLAFPSLTFYGFIDESGLQWEESAENFNNFDTSFNLIVTHTVPNLSCVRIEGLIDEYKTGMYGSKAFKGVWTDYPHSVEESSTTRDLNASDVEGLINEAALEVIRNSDPSTDTAVASDTGSKEPKNQTLADRIRSYVATTVKSSSGTVDAYAEKAKIRFDTQYASQKQAVDFAKNDAKRFNPSKTVTDSPRIDPNTDASASIKLTPTS
jgi:hypothetical protein